MIIYTIEKVKVLSIDATIATPVLLPLNLLESIPTTINFISLTELSNEAL